jgi:hypothetical protein
VISYLLIVYAITVDGPMAKPVAQFESYAQCVRVAQGIVPQLREQLGTQQVTARCIERTDA